MALSHSAALGALVRLREALPEITVAIVFIAGLLVILVEAAGQYGWFR